MKLTMWRVVVTLIRTRSFGEKESSSSFLHSKVVWFTMLPAHGIWRETVSLLDVT